MGGEVLNGFNFNGKNSLDFGIRIEDGVSFDSPERDVEFYEIKGRDGDLILDNSRLKSLEKSFPIVLFPVKGKVIEEQLTEISNWLKSSARISDLTYTKEPNYVYKATIIDRYPIESFLNKYKKAVISFRIQPYKYLKTGLNEITLPSSIANPTNRTAKPILTIKGTGNITVTIGKSVLMLKNVESGVRIDSLAQTITTLDKTRNLFTNMTSYPFPVIESGTQKITVTGTTTDVKIIPRWEVIV